MPVGLVFLMVVDKCPYLTSTILTTNHREKLVDADNAANAILAVNILILVAQAYLVRAM